VYPLDPAAMMSTLRTLHVDLVMELGNYCLVSEKVLFSSSVGLYDIAVICITYAALVVWEITTLEPVFQTLW